MAKTSDLDGALSTVCSRFTISCLNPYQKKAISEFVKGKSDIYVNLPTGYGKSLVYQALPTVFDSLTTRSGHIVVVVSPLVCGEGRNTISPKNACGEANQNTAMLVKINCARHQHDTKRTQKIAGS